MKINYITLTDETMASFRYRIYIPGLGLAKKGHEIVISKDVRPGVDVAVFSKHFDPTDPLKAEQAKKDGIKVVFDMCDYHNGDRHKAHYDKMLAVADVVTVPTDELARHIERATIVIPEPYQYEEAEARFEPEGDKLKLLWFGHQGNLNALIEEWNNIKGHYVLILTNPEAKDFTNIPVSDWSHQNMLSGMKTCDAVLIPVQNKTAKLCKSANRLVESIRRGRFVIASETPSHSEFRQFMWIGDIRQGLEWTLAHKDEIVPRIKAAQDYIRDWYSPLAITEKWENALCQ